MSSKKISGAKRRKLNKEKQEKQEKVLQNVPKLKTFFKKIGNELVTVPSAATTKDPLMDMEVEDPSLCASSCSYQKQTDLSLEYSTKSEISISVEEREVEDPGASSQSLLDLPTESVSESVQCILDINPDPALWDRHNSEMVDALVKNPITQNLNSIDFELSKRAYGTQNRYASKNLFYSTLVNGERVRREWLLYSPSLNSLFCVPCKLFARNEKSSFTTEGFNDWKNAVRLLVEHERSPDHRQNTKTYIIRSNVLGKIDSELHKRYIEEKEYWIQVLQRIVAVIKFLASRGLAFRGKVEKFGHKNNGNYMGVLELIAQYDTFLQNHIEKKGNAGRGHVSYMSSTICDEFTRLMTEQVENYISLQAQSSKYFSISVDSTPDITHSDKLSFMIRYTLNDGSIVERFVKFLTNVGHKAIDMESAVLQVLQDLSLDVKNCRGQSYDNASNMSGRYSGLQARILQHNKYAKFVPCSAHSLNLVGNSAAASCPMATKFFMFVEELYNFFSASTQRWETMEKNLLKDDGLKNVVPKRLNATRWSARADACKALQKGYNSFRCALQEIAEDPFQAMTPKVEATGLVKKLNELERGVMVSFWTDILHHFDKVNKSLQEKDMDMLTVVQLYDSLLGYISSLRDKFSTFENDGQKLSDSNVYKHDLKRTRMRKLPHGETRSDTQFDGRSDILINTYYVIIDRLTSELNKRRDAYQEIEKNFGFLLNLKTMDDKDISSKATLLRNKYEEDLDEEFPNECVQFKYLITALGNVESVPSMLKMIRGKNIVATFPNVDVALRIFLCIPATNCTTERSFSTLKRVKNYLRNSLGNQKVSDLALLSIESEILDMIDFSDLIEKFASMKSRKRL